MSIPMSQAVQEVGSEPSRRPFCCLQIVPSPIRGGCEDYALTIARALRNQGHSLFTACADLPELRSLIQDYRKSGADFLPVDLLETGNLRDDGFLHFAGRVRKTINLLKRVHPDVVHLALASPYWGWASLLACGLCRVPALVTFQLVPHTVPVGRAGRTLLRWARRRQQWSAVSNNNRDHIAASFGIPSEELLTVPNGADFSRFLPQGEAEKRQIRRDVRNEFCLDADALLLLTVGRLDAQKGYPDLIEAIPTVLQHHPKAHFLWVGDGEQRAEIEHQLAAMNLSGIVTLAGRRTDIPRLMAAADLFVFPTRFEGQPFSLLEAMAAEMAIVSTEASGIPEILRHEKEGLLCPVGDSSQLAGAIHTMLSRPEDQKRFGSAARARAGEFTEERMCRETIAVLQRLVTSSGALHA